MLDRIVVGCMNSDIGLVIVRVSGEMHRSDEFCLRTWEAEG